jgi:hypothetical protein
VSTYVVETTDPDYWPCPEGMDGHPTDDAAGGPCKACWAKVPKPGDEGCTDPPGYQCSDAGCPRHGRHEESDDV